MLDSIPSKGSAEQVLSEAHLNFERFKGIVSAYEQELTADGYTALIYAAIDERLNTTARPSSKPSANTARVAYEYEDDAVSIVVQPAIHTERVTSQHPPLPPIPPPPEAIPRPPRNVFSLLVFAELRSAV